MTTPQTLIDQELAQFGWVESVATNSISEFKSPKSNIEKEITNEKNFDLIDTFISHLIFYVIFCYSLILYIVIDLGIGSFITNKVKALFKLTNKPEIRSLFQLIPIETESGV